MTYEFDLSGKVAVVTGSTKGIGRGIIDGLAIAGADVVVVSRNRQDCERVAEEIRGHGRQALPFSADLTKTVEIYNLVETVVSHFGKIDVLFNNAGAAMVKKAEELTEEDWDFILNIDLKAVFFCAQAVGQQMIRQKSGKIINVSSIMGLVGDKQVLPYCVAKGGVIQMTKALALEWSRHNINVNALCPGYVATNINQQEFENEAALNYVIKKIPAHRLGTVDEMVGASVFLASEASNYMTGQSLVIDGGWTAE